MVSWQQFLIRDFRNLHDLNKMAKKSRQKRLSICWLRILVERASPVEPELVGTVLPVSGVCNIASIVHQDIFFFGSLHDMKWHLRSGYINVCVQDDPFSNEDVIGTFTGTINFVHDYTEFCGNVYFTSVKMPSGISGCCMI